MHKTHQSFLIDVFKIFQIQVLANLLETDDFKCKVGSLRTLSQITTHPSIRKKLTLMGGIELLMKIISDPDQELQVRLHGNNVVHTSRYRFDLRGGSCCSFWLARPWPTSPSFDELERWSGRMMACLSSLTSWTLIIQR